jgi:hypothetical protein
MRRKKRKPVGIWGRGCWQFNVLILLLLWFGLMTSWVIPTWSNGPLVWRLKVWFPFPSSFRKRRILKNACGMKKKEGFPPFYQWRQNCPKQNVLCFPSPTTIEHHSLLFLSVSSGWSILNNSGLKASL